MGPKAFAALITDSPASSARNGIDGNQCFTPPKCGTSGKLISATDQIAFAPTSSSPNVGVRTRADQANSVRPSSPRNPNTIGANRETGTVSAVTTTT